MFPSTPPPEPQYSIVEQAVETANAAQNAGFAWAQDSQRRDALSAELGRVALGATTSQPR